MRNTLPVRTHRFCEDDPEDCGCPPGIDPVEIGKQNRERIQALKAQGLSRKEISAELDLAHSTVCRHWE